MSENTQERPEVALDPITVEVIHNYLLSAAREMERNLMRTSYSTVIYELRDFGLGIYDCECRMLSEAPGLAVFTRGNDYGLQKTVEFVGEENMEPGDLLLTSYPYWSSAHPLDVLAVSPIFAAGELVGYTAIKQHWLDLGQKDPGYILDSVDVFQEGLLMPGLKLYKAGVLDQEVENLLRFNSRLPERIIGDLNAQISACRTGERRVAELVQRFGLDLFARQLRPSSTTASNWRACVWQNCPTAPGRPRTGPMMTVSTMTRC